MNPKWEIMNISLFFLWIFVLSKASTSTATVDSENCQDSKRLDELCGTHTFQSIKVILNYVDQLQKEKLNNNCDEKQNEIDDLGEQMQQLKLKVAEGKLSEDLLNLNSKFLKSKDDLLSSKNIYIEELKTKISELQNTNQVFKQTVESVNREIAQLKTFIKEILGVEISKIDSNASKLRYYEDQLKKSNKTIAGYSSQLKVNEDSLKSCQLMLSDTRNVVSEHKDQLEIDNKTIAENAQVISDLNTQIDVRDKALKELNELKNDLKKSLDSCEFNLNDARIVIHEHEVQLKDTQDTIAKNLYAIYKLKKEFQTMNQTLEECQGRLYTSESDLIYHKVIIQRKEREISRLKERINKTEVKPTTCIDTNTDSNSMQNVVVPNLRPFPTLCPELTIIQQRINGEGNFNRNWETYKNGFGQLTGDFFLGLETIHRLTNERPHILHIYMVERTGKTYYANYDNFRIAGESDKYRLLSLGAFTGTAGEDRMRIAEHQMFATFDNHTHLKSYNCPASLIGGWWYDGGDCTNCNLNKKYYREHQYKGCSCWSSSSHRRLTTVMMLIRPRGN